MVSIFLLGLELSVVEASSNLKLRQIHKLLWRCMFGNQGNCHFPCEYLSFRYHVLASMGFGDKLVAIDRRHYRPPERPL